MTTKISCQVSNEYVRANDSTGPNIRAVVHLSLRDVIQLLMWWIVGKTLIVTYEYTDDELMHFAQDLRHWYLVKSLRGYKRHAKK
jgi:hypothetical protein